MGEQFIMPDPGPSSSQQFHHSRSLASPGDASSTSSTPSINSPSQGTAASMMHSGPISRPSSGPDPSQLHQGSMPPALEFKAPNYHHPYNAGPTSSPFAQPGYPDISAHNVSRGATPGTSNTHLPPLNLQAQKRAYRQRRKDPSCDACRERKVKCDATDTTSCSECSSRNVKCQFTKETNRRMSSIKQVQDLEKQLAHARKQLHELRAMAKEGAPPHHSAHSLSTEHVSEVKNGQTKRTKPVIKQDLSRVRSSLRKVGVGVFKPPFPYNLQALSQTKPNIGLPALPPKHIADEILGQYRATFHATLPVLHWPSFVQQFEAVYREDSLRSVNRIWGALLFAVLGCGTLHRVRHDGQRFLDASKSLVDPWDEDLSLDHARCALLISILLVELNFKSAGWIWLGNAVRIAQDIGLHHEAQSWPSAEDEMRRRVWWSIYACDRLLALEFGRPPIIDDSDCEIGLPHPVDDQNIPSTGRWTPPGSSLSASPMLATFEVTTAISRVLRALRTSVFPDSTLQAYDTLFANCMAAFPPHHQLRINDYIHVYALPPLIYLQSARLMLHRHNLTPSCRFSERSAAIDRCLSVAQDTFQLLARCMQEPPALPGSPGTQDTWETRLRSAASAFLCTHIWRCTLFLCFRGEYNAALVCTRASSTIGDARPVNVACGRYLDFFLRRLVTKIQQGEGAYLENDEEMMAYVSGDLQGNVGSSWVWHGAENEARISPTAHSPFVAEPRGSSTGSGSPIIREGVIEWSGWDGILETLARLAQEQGPPAQRMHEGFTPRVQGNSVQLVPSDDPEHPQLIPFKPSRMHIANII